MQPPGQLTDDCRCSTRLHTIYGHGQGSLPIPDSLKHQSLWPDVKRPNCIKVTGSLYACGFHWSVKNCQKNIQISKNPVINQRLRVGETDTYNWSWCQYGNTLFLLMSQLDFNKMFNWNENNSVEFLSNQMVAKSGLLAPCSWKGHQRNSRK